MSLAESSTLDAEVKARTAFMRQELIQMGDRTLAAFVLRKPSLETRLPFIAAVRRYRNYTLPLKEEELLSTTWRRWPSNGNPSFMKSSGRAFIPARQKGPIRRVVNLLLNRTISVRQRNAIFMPLH